ncbi:MAG: VanZ family protein [Chitinophagales bacterium]
MTAWGKAGSGNWWAWAGLAAFLLAVLAGYVSPRAGAGAQEAFLRHLFGWPAPLAHLVVVAGRKLGHLLGYGFLGFALVHLLRPVTVRRRLLVVLSPVLVIAVADEWVQSLLPWRSGLVSDVFLDSLAGLLGAGLAEAQRATRGRERMGDRSGPARKR